MLADTRPILSVIVPVYNVEDTLSKCVDSILDQPFRDLELILVDDGSPDRSGAMCDEIAFRDSRVVVVHKANGGLSSARNAGLDIARGQFISFVDSDDWVSSDFYAENINILSHVKSLDMILTNVQKIYAHTESSPLRTLPEGQYVGKEACAEVIFSASVASLCMAIYRREVWEGLRFTEGILFEDSIIAPALADRINALHVSPHGIYYYLQREGSIMNSQWSAKKVRDYLDATIKVLEYLSEHNISNYLYRYAGALFYSLNRSILGQLQKKEQEEYLMRFEALSCPWSLIFRSKSLPLKHRIFLSVTKLLGVRHTNKILSLLPSRSQRS
ncbi:glycosyltransferase family 2 protein [Porphyromonas cangingivalis]|uniref:glycosyltransferase family 2 protein n=1 Tax=Porphyromonas cangingivalis TaxID=36874 RepID=UPI0006911644|nr:glycosyltransferase family 2 protein [Porphyromonas cangingivalis]